MMECQQVRQHAHQTVCGETQKLRLLIEMIIFINILPIIIQSWYLYFGEVEVEEFQ